jgi:hypothetical protein
MREESGGANPILRASYAPQIAKSAPQHHLNAFRFKNSYAATPFSTPKIAQKLPDFPKIPSPIRLTDPAKQSPRDPLRLRAFAVQT